MVGIALIIVGGRSRHVPIPFGPYLAGAGWIALCSGAAGAPLRDSSSSGERRAVGARTSRCCASGSRAASPAANRLVADHVRRARRASRRHRPDRARSRRAGRARARRRFATRFGAECSRSRGELDRAALRRLVFRGRRASAGTLDAFCIPLIRAPAARAARPRAAARTRSSRCRCSSRPTSARSSTGCAVVDCPESAQLERLTRRDGIPRTEALAMIAAQADRATRLRAAHDVIDNSGDVEPRADRSRSFIIAISSSRNRATRATTT